MVPVLNQLPTDAACVGVSTDPQKSPGHLQSVIQERAERNENRITISILVSPSSSIYEPNVGFHGSWQTF